MRRVIAIALALVATLTPLIGSAQTTDEGNQALFGNDDRSKAFLITRTELGPSSAENAVRDDATIDEALAQFNEIGTLGDELPTKDAPAIKGASPIRAWGFELRDKTGEIWLFAADGWFYVVLVYQVDEKDAIAWLEGAIASDARTLPTDPPKGLELAS